MPNCLIITVASSDCCTGAKVVSAFFLEISVFRTLHWKSAAGGNLAKKYSAWEQISLPDF